MPGGPCVRQRGQAGKAGTAAVREPSTAAGQDGRYAAALGRRQRRTLGMAAVEEAR
jgi:hypothetical protein